jgi:flagellar hook protein FlgE
MFETINIGTSGLLTHAQGLRTVGNNLANVNTPGFKSGQLVFSDLFNKGAGGGGQSGAAAWARTSISRQGWTPAPATRST